MKLAQIVKSIIKTIQVIFYQSCWVRHQIGTKSSDPDPSKTLKMRNVDKKVSGRNPDP
jgi:hypothetical protein